MTLESGSRLGPYEILSLIGAGGMGEVYKAHDTKLGREIAIKVLPEAFSQDKERLARFEREARLLASLNHPNIATIHDLEESDGVHFLVLEYVPGETLAERIKRGPIPVDETLSLFIQIAEGLEAAHEKGVIHRDLKPANIKITPEGKVKILDFGLAKAMVGEAADQGLSESPTMTRGATEAGILLGTAPYMSPEQARGKPVDRRADIWAFGCCLYEALTGKATFLGETVSDTIALLIGKEPDWERLPSTAPASVRRLLRRCFQKDPVRRLRDIGDARFDIEEALSEPDTAREKVSRPARLWRWALPVLIVGLALALLGERVVFHQPQPPPLVKRLVLPTHQDDELIENLYSYFALSPDGARLAYVGVRDGQQQLFVKSLDELEATPLRGTEGAGYPSFSPDGQRIIFLDDRKIKKIPVEGGPALTLTEGLGPVNWGGDDYIYYSTSLTSGIERIHSGGGPAETITTPDPATGSLLHRYPYLLPGGKAVLFTAYGQSVYQDLRIGVVSLETGEERTLVENGAYARYADSGHLIFHRFGVLMAVPFDLERIEVTGAAVPVVEGIRFAGSWLAPDYALSNDGTLVYATVAPEESGATLVWVDRDGNQEKLTQEVRRFQHPRLSPDGNRLIVEMLSEDGRSDCWIYHRARSTWTRLTFEGQVNESPIWAPDGRRVTFFSNRNDTKALYWKSADGSGPVTLLLESRPGVGMHPHSWTTDGKVLAWTNVESVREADIWMLTLGSENESLPFLATEFNEGGAVFSPDSRWLVYVSDESGRNEVYARAFPGPGGKWQVSNQGGVEPVWSRDGRKLFYRNDTHMMVVDIEPAETFVAGEPRLLFEGNYTLTPSSQTSRWANYDVSPDGQHFLMVLPQGEGARELNVIVNWHQELLGKVPVK